MLVVVWEGSVDAGGKPAQQSTGTMFSHLLQINDWCPEIVLKADDGAAVIRRLSLSEGSWHYVGGKRVENTNWTTQCGQFNETAGVLCPPIQLRSARFDMAPVGFLAFYTATAYAEVTVTFSFCESTTPHASQNLVDTF